jgi:hypothetical protein
MKVVSHGVNNGRSTAREKALSQKGWSQVRKGIVMSITVVQPYFECKLTTCLLRNVESDGVCAITLDLTDDQWWALLKKYDNSICVTSADCSMGVDPGFMVIEKAENHWIYGPSRWMPI